MNPMRISSVWLVMILIIQPLFSQDQFFEEHDRSYFKSTTFLFGTHFNKYEPLFERLNFDIFDQSGAYDFTGVINADSTNFLRRSNYFGMGFNANGIQFLMSGGFRRTSILNVWNLGFGMGFNHVLHFSYKTGQPKVWFEGLLNYNYINNKIKLKSYDITQPPMAFIDDTQFPDIGIVVGGEYNLNVESNFHILEPVAALNFALSQGIALRFAAGYSLFLNRPKANFLLRFKPDPAENSLAKPDQLIFDKTPDKINLDFKQMDRFPLDLNRWNFNVSIVFRLFGEAEPQPETRTTYF